MRVLCDEHVPEAVAAALRSEGIDAVRVGTELDLGTSDDDLLTAESLASRTDFVPDGWV